MANNLNKRGKIAVWSFTAGLLISIVTWDWKPVALGAVIMLALAATGGNLPKSPPGYTSEPDRSG